VDDQVAQLVGEGLGLGRLGEVAVLQTPGGDGVDDPVDHLLERGLPPGLAEGATEILLGQDVGRVEAPPLRHLDALLFEGDDAVPVVRDARITPLPLDLVVRVNPFGGEVPADPDAHLFRGNGHVASCEREVAAYHARGGRWPPGPCGL
jgi:hypothetical protein